MFAPEVIDPLGIINSLAPPIVLPPPMNPGANLKIGDATPELGVGNSITLNPVGLCCVVSFSEICLAFNPRISSAAVSKTSTAPGFPRFPDARVIGVFGTIRARILGTALDNAF